MNRLLKIVIGLFITQLAVAGTSSPRSPLSITIANDQKATITLSSADINRIFVKKDKIASVNAPHNRLIAHNDQSGSIYINVIGKAPFTAFVTTQKGRHFSLFIVPKSKPGVTVRFIPKTPIRVHYRRHNWLAKRFERSTPYENTLIHLLRDTMRHKVPPGYTSISPNAFGAINALKVPKYLNAKKILSEKVIAGFLGGALAVRVIKVSNHSKRSIPLVVSDLYMPGVRAIAIARASIPPHQSTYVYEVMSNV